MARYPKGYMSTPIKVGDRFGKLVVQTIERISAGSLQSPDRTTIGARCQCDCGKQIVISLSRLRRGVKGCRCQRITAGKSRLKGNVRGQSEAYSSLRLSAVKRDIPFTLSLENFAKIAEKSCYYCGIESSRKIDKYIFNGIDRLDNSLGYSFENGVPSCKKCNLAKNVMAEPEFYAWVRQVYEHIKDR